MSVSINGTNGLVFSDGTSLNTSPFTGGFGFRNRIINGDMRIDQRNAGASVTPTATSFNVDRWQIAQTQSSKVSVQQNAGSVVPPAGFKKYLGVTSLSAYTLGAGDLFILQQPIEAYNVEDFNWGTSNASSTTISFWVRSSLTGTFGGYVGNYTSPPSNYPFSYTINAANTWEYKTVTIPGSTTGTWQTGNIGGIVLGFSLGVGTTYSGTANTWANGTAYYAPVGAKSVVGTNGATFYITGVQLEKGSTATSFDYRPYGTELALCQRYFSKSFDELTAPINGGPGAMATTNGLATGYSFNNTNSMMINFPVPMRIAPTIVTYGDNNGYWYNGGTGFASNSYASGGIGTKSMIIRQQGYNGVTHVQGHWTASAEL